MMRSGDSEALLAGGRSGTWLLSPCLVLCHGPLAGPVLARLLTPDLCSPADLRLQLLDVKNNPYLIKALYGLLMLLPQSSAFQLLSHRLQCVPNPELLQTE